MQVILRSDVDKVGLRGEVVDVAPGYARNFLLPRKLAELATPGRVAELQRIEANRARHQAQTFEQAQDLARTLEEAELRFDVQAGQTGTLFGSVTATDIAEELWRARRIRVDRRKIELPESIKRVGRYEVPVELFADVTATLRLAVVPEGGELPEPETEALVESGPAEGVSGERGGSAGEPTRAEQQVPSDAFDRAADTAVETPTEGIVDLPRETA